MHHNPSTLHASFQPGVWQECIDVRDFILRNYRPYLGDGMFLVGPTKRTTKLWQYVTTLMREESKTGVLDIDTHTPSSITSHPPGYIAKEDEIIKGLQTDAPLKRAIKPQGGVRLAQAASKAYGYSIPESIIDEYTHRHTTHNDAVFAVYTDEHRLLRSHHIITGLPDNYGRGRIIGDYRRVSLYGIDALIQERHQQKALLRHQHLENGLRIKKEITEQIQALQDMKIMALSYGVDISQPASNFWEAVQWLYFSYLSAVKQQDGAAMSLGRIDSFLDIYAQRDLEAGLYSEQDIQEIIDDFVIKLRMVRQLRTPEYNELFAGDPTWVTLVLGGTTINGVPLVTQTSYRFLQTLRNLGSAPEPNITIFWSDTLPQPWKEFCSGISVSHSAIQYISDSLMKEHYGDDCGIACCVSGMNIGKEMQYFGARANLAKMLLLAINGGKTEPINHDHPGGEVIIPGLKTLAQPNKPLQFDEVWHQFLIVLEWVSERYVQMMNAIHWSHDIYNYESAQMALHDVDIKRNMAFGLAGLSVVVDSLSAIKHATVTPVVNDHQLAEAYTIAGEFPSFGNDNDQVDTLAIEITKAFHDILQSWPLHRDARPTVSILTITSNVVYGKATGTTPDGRPSMVPFAPGANPFHGRELQGPLSSLNSVAKIPYHYCLDGISNTFSIIPQALGKNSEHKVANLIQILDGYFTAQGGQHLNVNVLDKELLRDAQKHPEKYPQLTIRVSGYCVLFHKLSTEQQEEVINRTFHE